MMKSTTNTAWAQRLLHLNIVMLSALSVRGDETLTLSFLMYANDYYYYSAVSAVPEKQNKQRMHSEFGDFGGEKHCWGTIFVHIFFSTDIYALWLTFSSIANISRCSKMSITVEHRKYAQDK